MMVMRSLVAAILLTVTGVAVANPAVVRGEPLSDDLMLTVVSRPPANAADQYRKPDHALNTLDDLYAQLRSCWLPPLPADAVEGMQLSVLFSFDAAGRAIAAPRITFTPPGTPDATVGAYLKSVTTSLAACQPLKLTPALGDAIAGRPIMIRYVDNRALSLMQSGAK
jgi:hypothetical protein